MLGKYSVRSSAMRLVSVVTSTRSLRAARRRISDSRSSTWVRAGRTSTCGSTRPVGRTTCSTILSAVRLLVGPGVAETKIVCGARALPFLELAAADCPAPRAGGIRIRPAFPCGSGRPCTCRPAAGSSHGFRRRPAWRWPADNRTGVGGGSPASRPDRWRE